MKKEEILKDLAEIEADCDYIMRRIQILKSNARAVADAIECGIRKEAAK